MLFGNLKFSWSIGWRVCGERYRNWQFLMIALVRVLAGSDDALLGAIWKEWCGNGKEKPKRSNKHLGAGSRRASSTHLCLTGQEEGGVARTWQEVWLQKVPGDEHTQGQTSTQPGRWEKRSKGNKYPEPHAHSLFSFLFSNPNGRGGHGSQLMQSTDIHFLAHAQWRVERDLQEQTEDTQQSSLLGKILSQVNFSWPSKFGCSYLGPDPFGSKHLSSQHCYWQSCCHEWCC